VGEAANGREAVAVVRHAAPDVLLVDLQMPELDGVGAIQEIRTIAPATRILVLTTYDSDADILRAVEAGATGYMLKDTPREELFKAIRATARGESVLSPTVASKLVGRARGPLERSLSAREIEVLALVARGVSNKIIGKDLRISEATVKTHLLHIFAKLGVDDRTAAVTAAMEKGVLRLAK
jgi:DNA-binding NarL/FixJ family response regulator